MTEARKKWIREQARFQGIFDRKIYKDSMFGKKIPLSSSMIYEEEKVFTEQIFEAEFSSRQTIRLEEELAGYIGPEAGNSHYKNSVY